LQQAGKQAETEYLQQVHGSSTHHETSTGGGGTQQIGFGQQSPASATFNCPAKAKTLAVSNMNPNSFAMMYL